MNLLLQTVLNKWFFVDFFYTFRGFNDIFIWSCQQIAVRYSSYHNLLSNTSWKYSDSKLIYRKENSTYMYPSIDNPGIPVAVQLELVHVYPAGIYFLGSRVFFRESQYIPIKSQYISTGIYIGIPLLLCESRNFIQVHLHPDPASFAGIPKFYPSGIPVHFNRDLHRNSRILGGIPEILSRWN